jgi:hypothetical protein
MCRVQQRSELIMLTDRGLRDIGITRLDAGRGVDSSRRRAAPRGTAIRRALACREITAITRSLARSRNPRAAQDSVNTLPSRTKQVTPLTSIVRSSSCLPPNMLV